MAKTKWAKFNVYVSIIIIITMSENKNVIYAHHSTEVEEQVSLEFNPY